MPVITRNQSKKLTSINTIRDYDVNVVKQAGQKTVPVEYRLSVNESQFVSDIQRLLNKCDLATGKTAKMQVSLQIYNRVNDKLEKFLQTEHLKWIKFAATIYNKTSEFEAQRETFTPFYISNADFYVVLNHIKIIYSSSLFFVFYFLEHIFLVFRKHP